MRDEAHLQPLYIQVQAALEEMLNERGYGPGDQIPAERELVDLFGVSRMTIRRAIDTLSSRGVLEVVSTKGTFVAEPAIVRQTGPKALLSLSEVVEKAGFKSTWKLLSFESIPAPRDIAKHLNLRIGRPLMVIKRLRMADDHPFCVETAHLDAERIPGFDSSDLEASSSLFRLLEDRYGIKASGSEEVYKVAYATAEEAGHLGLSPGVALLFRTAVTSDADGRAFEYSTSANHPGRVIFQTIRTG